MLHIRIAEYVQQIGWNNMSPIVITLMIEDIRRSFVRLNQLIDEGIFFEAFGSDSEELLEGIVEDLGILLSELH